MDDHDRRHQVARRLRRQGLSTSRWNNVLLLRAADAVEDGDAALWRVLEPIADLRHRQAPALRLLAAAHRLALDGEAPDYAEHLPTCGGDGDAEAAWPAFVDLCASGALATGVHRPVQTNEPRRAAALLPAFAAVQREVRMPLRLLEIGSSAGLLLRFDRYRYEIGDRTWGDPSSPVWIRAHGDVPVGPVDVTSRRGCDPSPLDPVADRTQLLSWIWPDELERFRTVEAALDVAAAHPVTVDAAPASAWLAGQLADPPAGVATIVFHSIVWQYLPDDEQEAVARTITSAGAQATTEAPLAWLRFEPHVPEPARGAEVRLRLWPGGDDRSLAMSGYHGTPIVWPG